MFLEGQCFTLRTLCILSSLEAFSKFLCSILFSVGLGLVKASVHALETSLYLSILGSAIRSCNTQRGAETIF